MSLLTPLSLNTREKEIERGDLSLLLLLMVLVRIIILFSGKKSFEKISSSLVLAEKENESMSDEI